MASSKKSPSNELAQHVAGILSSRLPRGSRIAVALSGGIDSVVLLDILASLAEPLACSISALHVNHQLSPNAARWAEFCASLCRRYRFPCRIERVAVSRQSGDGLEAAARAARYAVYAQSDADFIALGHHLDDQAETLLLQLLRGAGVKGLSAMPMARKLPDGPTLLRPLLAIPRSELEACAQARGLRWIEDESNADTGFDRNFLRHQIFPALTPHFPAYRATLGRAAAHLAEAAQLLDQLAALDGAAAIAGASLRLAALRALDAARAKNLLRYFLDQHGVSLPSATRLAEALRQLLHAASDAQLCIELDGCELHRYGGAAHLVRRQLPLPAAIAWQGEDRVPLPHGTLHMERTQGAGLALARLTAAPVTLRLRHGGEKIQPDCRRPRRSLKNLLQEGHIPPWQRAALPLLFCGEHLAWAAEIGSDCAYQAQAGEAAVLPRWQPLAQAMR